MLPLVFHTDYSLTKGLRLPSLNSPLSLFQFLLLSLFAIFKPFLLAVIWPVFLNGRDCSFQLSRRVNTRLWGMRPCLFVFFVFFRHTVNVQNQLRAGGYSYNKQTCTGYCWTSVWPASSSLHTSSHLINQFITKQDLTKW